jgi:hypothetical protein
VLAGAIKVAEKFLQGSNDTCKGLGDLLKVKKGELNNLDLEEGEEF